jgi:SNF2 family DNA or RNA helicase
VVADAKARGFSGATLVLAPKSILTTAWAADAAHFPTLRVVVCWADSPAKRRRLIGQSADVYVTNYECFKKHSADFLAAGVTRLVIDESSKIKCPTTQISRACHEFADAMTSVYVLSGTPAPNNQTEYWSQMRCVDRAVFGPSFWRFAYAYFSPVKRTIDGRERIVGWKPLGQSVRTSSNGCGPRPGRSASPSVSICRRRPTLSARSSYRPRSGRRTSRC